jgi:hypothetical protein
MFKLFHNKDKKTKIIDKVFMHKKSKWNYCQKILSENPKTVYIGWFDETITELEEIFKNSAVIVLNARKIHKAQVEGSAIIFIEHHPMKSKEETVLNQLGLTEAIVLSALDEPLLMVFGGEKLIKVMQSLGMNEDEIIEHKMVTQSIANAQERIEKKLEIEQSMRSQSDWIEKNFK